MVTEKKEMTEERWNKMTEPVNAWVEAFEPTNEDEEDRLELVNMNLRRGNRNGMHRSNIIRQWRAEFSEEISSGEFGFGAWARTNIDKKVLGQMTKTVEAMDAPRLAFWEALGDGQKPTFSVKVGKVRKTFQHPTFDHWNGKEKKTHLARLKKLHSEGEDWTAQAPVWVAPTLEESEKSEDSV